MSLLWAGTIYAAGGSAGGGGTGGAAGVTGGTGTGGGTGTSGHGHGGGGGGGGGGGNTGGNGGNGAGGGILIYTATTLTTTSSTIDNRGGGASTTNGGTVKMYYASGSAPNTAGVTSGRTFIVNTTPQAPVLITPSSGQTGVSINPIFTLRSVDEDYSDLNYYIQVYNATNCGGSLVRTIDQESDQTGWELQNNYNGQGYIAGYTISESAIARHRYIAPGLTPNQVHSWRARSIDYEANGTYSPYSSCSDFTTAPIETNIGGGTTIRGGTIIL